MIISSHCASRLTRQTVVTYEGCFVDTTNGAIDVETGIFNVSTAGVYQITFTAKYVSSSMGRFGAWSDVFVNNIVINSFKYIGLKNRIFIYEDNVSYAKVIADSQREYNGEGSNSKTESSTHSILVYYPLRVGDLVKVQFNKDGASYIHSDRDHDVHFTARMVGPFIEKAQDL